MGLIHRLPTDVLCLDTDRYYLHIITTVKRKTHPKKEMKTPAGLRGRIWIDGSEGTFLGYGRVVLLEKIREFGSISKAAKFMDMSFRHAWQLIDSMNRQAGKPLVEAVTGGKGGGGARLTDEGERVVAVFWKIYADFESFLKREQSKLPSKWRRNII